MLRKIFVLFAYGAGLKDGSLYHMWSLCSKNLHTMNVWVLPCSHVNKRGDGLCLGDSCAQNLSGTNDAAPALWTCFYAFLELEKHCTPSPDVACTTPARGQSRVLGGVS